MASDAVFDAVVIRQYDNLGALLGPLHFPILLRELCSPEIIGTEVMELFDPSGDIWPGVNQELIRKFESSLLGNDLADYLVRNLGWVSVRQAAGICKIKCRPSIMTDATLVTLLFCVHDCPDNTTFALDIVGQDCIFQLIREKSTATTILAALVGVPPAGQFWPGEKFMMTPLHEAASPFGRTFNEVRTLAERADDIDDVAARISQILGTRWSISSHDNKSGDWVEQFNSGGFTPFNPVYSGRQKGARLAEYAADTAYVQWVSEGRKKAVDENRVDLAAVDAIVTFDRVGEARLRYHRMYLPVTMRNGSRAVLMSAQTDTSINLRK